MKCRECGVEMNHHAEKLVEPTSAEEASQIDAALGALVEEFFTCPHCGICESRRTP